MGFFPSSSQMVDVNPIVVKMAADIYYEWDIETSEYGARQKDASNKSNEQRQIQLFRAKVRASGKAHKVKIWKYDGVSSNTTEKQN